MAKIPAVTFKNEPRITGLAAVGRTPGAAIKVGKLQVGSISGTSWVATNHHHKVRLMVKEVENPCGWKWVELKYRGESLKTTKEWIKANWEAIYTKYDLHTMEPF